MEETVAAFDEGSWQRVARAAGIARSAPECRLEWRQRMRPSVNTGLWSEEEDARLVQLAAKHQKRNVCSHGLSAVCCAEVKTEFSHKHYS